MAYLLPEELIFLEILSRLPVKFLIRLTLVCKRWLTLITERSPIQSYLSLTSLNLHHSNSLLLNNTFRHYGDRLIPLHKNDYLDTCNEIFDIVRISTDDLVVIGPRKSVYVVGSVNGLVCFRYSDAPQVFVVLNPITKFFKTVALPPSSPSTVLSEKIVGHSCLFSYDQIDDDFKIVVFEEYELRSAYRRLLLKVHVYSCNNESWNEIRDSTLPVERFFILSNRNERPFPFVIFLSNPHVLMVFDVHKEVFKRLPCFHDLIQDESSAMVFINWMGSFAVLAFHRQVESAVYTIDETGATWVKSYVVPDCLKPDQLVLSFNNGNLLLENHSKLFLFEADKHRSKKLIVGDDDDQFDVIEYTESLFCIKGMKRNKKQTNKKRKNRL